MVSIYQVNERLLAPIDLLVAVFGKLHLSATANYKQTTLTEQQFSELISVLIFAFNHFSYEIPITGP